MAYTIYSYLSEPNLEPNLDNKALMPQQRASTAGSSPWYGFTFKNIVATYWQVLDLPTETPKKSAGELDDTPTEVEMKAASIS